MKKNKICGTALVAMALLFFLLPQTLAYGPGDNTVKVGYVPGYGVVNRPDAVTNVGYGYDILKAAEQYSELEFEFVPVTLDTVRSSLDSGTIDIFGPQVWTSADAMNFTYSREFGRGQIVLAATENAPYYYDDFASFQGATVTTVPSANLDSHLETYASANGISFNRQAVNSLEDLLYAENQLILTSPLMDTQDWKLVANLGVESMYFVASRGSSDLMTALDDALNALEVNNPAAYSNAQANYISISSLSKPVLTAGQNELFLAKNSFEVGYLVNYLPMEGADDRGAPSGVMVELMDALAAEGGFSVHYTPYTIGENVDHSKFDLNIAFASYQDFSQFYWGSDSIGDSSPMMVVAESGLASASSLTTLGTLPLVTVEMQDLQASYPNAQFSTYDSYAALAKAIEKGEVEGGLVSNISSDYLLFLLGDTGYDRYSTNLNQPFQIFVSKNIDPGYVGALNTLIHRLDEDLVEKAFISHISTYRDELTFLELCAKYWYIYLIGVLLVGGGFFALYLFLEQRKKQQVAEALNTDEVTGLLTEAKFVAEVEEALHQVEPGEYMLVAFDVDHFSLIHKQYGYERSNEILNRIGKLLTKSFPPEALICRAKADLFLIFTKLNLDDQLIKEDDVLDCTQDLLASTYPLSVSEGLYRIQDPTVPVQLMIDFCNLARQQGKNVYGLTLNEYTKELDSKRELNNSIVLRMERALLGKELIPYYQPKVHLKTNMVTGCEALVRWCDIDADLEVPRVKYMPDEFIPLFEENGFIAKLDYHIFGEVCSFIRRNVRVATIPKISVNLSGVTLLKNDLRGSLMDTLESYRLLPREIDIEITESAFTQYPKESASRVRMLGKEGFTISMDDFGTGASSLNRLKDMDITTIKLDKAFLDYNLSELKGSVIIGNMINMARRLGLEVVAEGVETKEQLSALKMLHCDLVQGYYYSRPVNEDDFLEMLQEPVCLTDKERQRLRAERLAAEFVPDGPMAPDLPVR